MSDCGNSELRAIGTTRKHRECDEWYAIAQAMRLRVLEHDAKCERGIDVDDLCERMDALREGRDELGSGQCGDFGKLAEVALELLDALRYSMGNDYRNDYTYSECRGKLEALGVSVDD